MKSVRNSKSKLLLKEFAFRNQTIEGNNSPNMGSPLRLAGKPTRDTSKTIDFYGSLANEKRRAATQMKQSPPNAIKDNKTMVSKLSQRLSLNKLNRQDISSFLKKQSEED